MYKKMFVTLIQSENALLRRRYALPEISCISKYSTNSKNKNDEDDAELDKPIKYSTSEAAKWISSNEKRNQHIPSYQVEVVTFSLIVLYIYFGYLREENDIDLKMIENIPVDVLEQIYGKENIKKYNLK